MCTPYEAVRGSPLPPSLPPHIFQGCGRGKILEGDATQRAEVVFSRRLLLRLSMGIERCPGSASTRDKKIEGPSIALQIAKLSYRRCPAGLMKFPPKDWIKKTGDNVRRKKKKKKTAGVDGVGGGRGGGLGRQDGNLLLCVLL